MSSTQYFNGNILSDNATVKNRLQIGSTGSFTAGNNVLLLNQSIIPSGSEIYLGSVENPFRSIYVNTGSVFIGPTGSFEINSNGLIASTEGFAAPFYQVGSLSPGQGILLFEQNNILYFADQIGSTGAVSVFNITPGSQFDTYYSLSGNVGFGVTGPQYKLDVLGNIHVSDTILATSFSGTNLYISSVESTNSTLNIATSSNTNTVNIGTSNSIQTVNIGTVGTGQTTINIGGIGDTVNVAGNLVYVNSTITEISNPRFIINQSGTNINNTGITVFQNGGPTGAYILVNSSSNAWTLKAGSGSLVTLNQDVSTGANVTFGSATASNITTNVLNFDSIGSIYFQTGSATGCYITKVNYNSSGANHYVYYNSTTSELSHQSPTYFFSYSTGTQSITGASTSSSSTFQPVTFNVNALLYPTFQHTSGSSIFTGTFDNQVTLQLTYNLQFHSTENATRTAAGVIYLDGSPIAGSYRSCTVATTNTEHPLSNTVLVTVPKGIHTFELRAAATAANSVNIGGTSNILPPGNSYNSVNFMCTRVI